MNPELSTNPNPNPELSTSTSQQLIHRVVHVETAHVQEEPYRIIKLKIEKSYEPFDEATTAHLEQQASMYKSQHYWRDTHMDYSESFDIDDYVSKTLIIDGKPPSGLGLGWFVLASLFLCTWPYRIWVETHSHRCEYVLFF